MERCGWVSQDPLYIAYHDNEWGVPETDSKKLFEMICLEGQQAGLSWITVLKKRENYRACFHQFDPVKVAAMQEEDVERLVQDAGIIRHRKVQPQRPPLFGAQHPLLVKPVLRPFRVAVEPQPAPWHAATGNGLLYKGTGHKGCLVQQHARQRAALD